MTRREALAKATITTADAAAGLLPPETARAFIRTLKDKSPLGAAMRLEIRGAPSGEIDKLTTGRRLIRSAPENADDGYRAGAAFATVAYQTTKIRLPWEVTEDVYHENIAGEALEAQLTDEMTTQFALDLDDLDVNGDTAAVGGDAPFLNIDDGLVKQIAVANRAGRNINAAAINGGAPSPGLFFELRRAMPAKYLTGGNLRWIVNPLFVQTWWEYLTTRPGAAGDLLLGAPEGSPVNRPLNIPFLEVPSFPEDTLILADPRNFVRVVSWSIRKRRVTGETDASLAARDKRFYVFFMKRDVIIEELDSVVRAHSLVV